MISEIRNETGTQKLVGYVIEVGHADGSARCWLDLDERHLNRHNVLHGGIATMLLDSASGAAGSLTVLSQILLKFECGDRLDTITLRAPQIAEMR